MRRKREGKISERDNMRDGTNSRKDPCDQNSVTDTKKGRKIENDNCYWWKTGDRQTKGKKEDGMNKDT